MKSRSLEAILWVKLDRKRTLKKHATLLRSKENSNLPTLLCFLNYKCLEKRRILMKSMIMSHSNYYPFIWMTGLKGFLRQVCHNKSA